MCIRDSLNAETLSALGGKTAGDVTVSNAVVISGTQAQVTAALVTADTKVEAGTADVTITGGGGDDINAEDLSAIGGATGGDVTVNEAINIVGTTAQVTAALVTDDTKVIASTATVALDEGQTPTVSQLNDIADATDGVVTATLAAAALADFGALSTESDDEILSLIHI